jgi:hypothetical protein
MAAVDAVHLGPNQAEARSPDREWPEAPIDWTPPSTNGR